MSEQGNNVSVVESEENVAVEFPFWLQRAYEVPHIEFAKRNEKRELEDLGYPDQWNDSFKQVIIDSYPSFDKPYLIGKYSVLWKKSIWSLAAIAFVCIAIIAQLVFGILTDFSYYESHDLTYKILNIILFFVLSGAIPFIRIGYDVYHEHRLFVINILANLYKWKRFVENTNRVLDISKSTTYHSSYIDRLSKHFEDERASSPEFISITPNNRVKVSEITSVEIKYTYLKTQILVILVVLTSWGAILAGAIYLNFLLNPEWLSAISYFSALALISVTAWKLLLWFTLGRTPTFLQKNQNASAQILVYLKDQKKPKILHDFGHEDYAIITEKYLTEEISIRLKNKQA